MISNTLIAVALSVPLTPDFIVKDANMVAEAQNLINSNLEQLNNLTQVHFEIPHKSFITAEDASSAIDEIAAMQTKHPDLGESWMFESMKDDLAEMNAMLDQNLMTVELDFPDLSLSEYWHESEVQ
jgi:hypothetical protein